MAGAPASGESTSIAGVCVTARHGPAGPRADADGGRDGSSTAVTPGLRRAGLTAMSRLPKLLSAIKRERRC